MIAKKRHQKPSNHKDWKKQYEFCSIKSCKVPRNIILITFSDIAWSSQVKSIINEKIAVRDYRLCKGNCTELLRS